MVRSWNVKGKIRERDTKLRYRSEKVRKKQKGIMLKDNWCSVAMIGEESRKCFLVAAEKRDEATLLPIIPSNGLSQAHYSIRLLESKLHGYVHRIVNQSKEFVDEDGDNTNKIEGHGSQVMCKMPKFEVRKHIFSLYLTDFIRRYMHKTRTCSKYF